MPSGFDVETGSNLSERLVSIVFDFQDYLRNRRAESRAPSPITGSEICFHYSSRHILIEGPDVRAMVNYLRRRGAPIASTGNGYFWAKTFDELEGTITHLKQRRDAIDAVIDGLARSRENMNTQPDLFENLP